MCRGSTIDFSNIISDDPKALKASAFAISQLFCRSEILLTSRIPLPPPPAAALIIKGNPTLSAAN